MEQLIEVLKEKSKKHLGKIEQHNKVKEDLEREYNALNGDTERKEKVRSQLLTTYKQIEYHQGSSKTYNKVINMIRAK